MGTWDFDIARGESRIDRRGRELLGLDAADAEQPVPLEEAMGRIHPDDHPEIDRALAAAQAPGSDGWYDVEYRVLMGGGRGWTWQRARGRMFSPGHGCGATSSGRSPTRPAATPRSGPATCSRRRWMRLPTSWPDSTPDGAVLYLNRGGRDWIGLPATAPLGGVTLTRCHPPLRRLADPRGRHARGGEAGLLDRRDRGARPRGKSGPRLPGAHRPHRSLGSGGFVFDAGAGTSPTASRPSSSSPARPAPSRSGYGSGPLNYRRPTSGSAAATPRWKSSPASPATTCRSRCERSAPLAIASPRVMRTSSKAAAATTSTGCCTPRSGWRC